ncbi:MAG: TIGR01212 family radical SAM protein [Pirellulaceae bacterium]|nr:TIGR01212 family radical SAM protein [Pirellulaceae bacterium]
MTLWPRLATRTLSKKILSQSNSDDLLAWKTEGLVLNAFGASLRRRFGGRVQRVSVDAGFTCPNVDGAVAKGGCNFCDNRSFSPSRRVRLKQVREQLVSGIESVRRRYDKVDQFIAYFQPATNTYAPVDQLAELYRLALSCDVGIVGLAIGTRPDCVPDSVLEMIDAIGSDHHVSVEYGMQTIHDQGLDWMNRAHRHADMINAIDRSRGLHFETCAHVILGIPGETHEMMMQTAGEIGRLGFDAIKLHNLYAVRGTPLGQQVLAGEIEMMRRDDYVQTVVDFLERIPPEVVVERVSGDAPPDFLIEPKWCLEKSSIRLEIEREFKRRGTVQGDAFTPPAMSPDDRARPSDTTPDSIRRQIDQRGRLPVLKMESADR